MWGMEASVRRAAPGDAAQVARLLNDFNTEFGEPSPEVEVLAARVRVLLENGEITALVGGDGPDGLAVIRLRPWLWADALDAYLEELYVASGRRRQGLGRALLEAAMAVAREAGAAHMDLATSVDDTAARGLYESCGFTNREQPPDGPVMLFYEREL